MASCAVHGPVGFLRLSSNRIVSFSHTAVLETSTSLCNRHFLFDFQKTLTMMVKFSEKTLLTMLAVSHVFLSMYIS